MPVPRHCRPPAHASPCAGSSAARDADSSSARSASAYTASCAAARCSTACSAAGYISCACSRPRVATCASRPSRPRAFAAWSAAGAIARFAARSFGCGDQLQQFLRVAEPVLHRIGVGAQGLRGEQTRGQRIALGGVFRDETNFVDSNVWNAGQRRFQLLGQDRGLGIVRGESAHQPFEVFLRDARRELNAGEACGRKQLGKAALGGGSINGHAIEQKLRAGGAQQQAGFIGDGNRLVQFVPCGIELLGCARMIKAVEPRIFEQNVEAAYEGARGCLFGID